MAGSDQRPPEPNVRPAGAEGDGMDRYPTYRDGPAMPSSGSSAPVGSGVKPTDVNLPRSRRTYALPLLIGLAVFAAIIIIRIVWGGINVTSTSDEALTPGDAATPPAAASAPASATPQAAAPATEIGATANSSNEAAPAETQTSPGEVEAAPSAVDVPGGATTTPVEPAPQQ